MLDAGDPTIEGDALVYTGKDDRGIELLIVAVPDDRQEVGIAVIHAMPTSYNRRMS